MRNVQVGALLVAVFASAVIGAWAGKHYLEDSASNEDPPPDAVASEHSGEDAQCVDRASVASKAQQAIATLKASLGGPTASVSRSFLSAGELLGEVAEDLAAMPDLAKKFAAAGMCLRRAGELVARPEGSKAAGDELDCATTLLADATEALGRQKQDRFCRENSDGNGAPSAALAVPLPPAWPPEGQVLRDAKGRLREAAFMAQVRMPKKLEIISREIDQYEKDECNVVVQTRMAGGKTTVFLTYRKQADFWKLVDADVRFFP